jgi:hypothetical protein
MMGKCMRAGILAALFGMVVIAGVHAANPSIPTYTSGKSMTYAPDDGVVSVDYSVKVRCNGYIGSYYLAFSEVSVTSSSGDRLAYSVIASDGGILYKGGAPTGDYQVLSGSFASGSASSATLTSTYHFLVSPSALPSAKRYTVKMKMSLYKGSSGSGSYVSYKTVNLYVTVGKHLDVAAVSEGAGFNVNATSVSMAFGNLAAGDARKADIVVRSNIAYSLYLTSANGALVNAEDSTSKVAYALSSNGSAITLAAGTKTAIASGATATYSATRRYALEVTISAFDFPTAGSYSDTLTINVAAP